MKNLFGNFQICKFFFFFELETMRENFGIKLTFYSHWVNTHFYSYKVTIGMDQELPS